MGVHAQVHLWKSESNCGSVRVSLLLLPCGFWASNSAHQTWCQAPLPLKPPLQHPPVDFTLQSVFVCILVPYGHIAPQAKKTPFPPCPCLCHLSSLLPKLVTRQLVFSAVSLGRQPAAAPSAGGRKEWSELVFVVELSEGWKLLCSGQARGRPPEADGTNLESLCSRLCVFRGPEHTRPSRHQWVPWE